MEAPLNDDAPAQRELFCVTGSTALDTLAKQDIRQHLVSKGIISVSDNLLASGLGQELGAALEISPTLPCWVALLEQEDGIIGKTVGKLFSRTADGQPSYLVGKYGHCFGGLSDRAVMEKLFPPALNEPDTSLTASSESVVTPENEKRVFTFDNEPIVVVDKEDAFEDGDDVAGDLPVIPKTPEPRSSSSFSSAGRGSSADGSDNQLTQSRPASTGPSSAPSFKARPAPTNTPSITPRLTKAAALRLGLEIPEKTRPASQNSISPVPSSAPPKSPMAPLKSLAQPSITPKLNKASLARLEKDKDPLGPVFQPATVRRQSYSTSERSRGYEGMAGFGGRRLSTQATVSAAPKIVPKQTKASALRSSTIEGVLPALPTTTTRRQSYSTAERAALFGSVSASSSKDPARRISIASLQAPTSMPKENKASLLRNGGGAKVLNSSTSGGHARTSTTGSSASQASSLGRTASPAPAHSTSVMSNHSQTGRPASGQASHDAPLKVKKPAIVPRVNKAAELRMAARNGQKI